MVTKCRRDTPEDARLRLRHPALMSLISKHQFQRELNGAESANSIKRAESAIAQGVGACQALSERLLREAEATEAEATKRRAKTRMIQHVEQLGSKLQLERFAKM